MRPTRKKNRTMRRMAWVAVIVSAVATGLVSSCQQKAKASGHHRLRQVFVPNQQFFYFVGQPLRAAAIVEAEKRADPDWQEFQAFKAWKAHGTSGKVLGLESDKASSVLANNCGKCHGGASPQAGLFLDGLHTLTAAQITNAQRMIITGQMPPKTPIKDGQLLGDIMQDLLDLEETQKEGR